MKKRAQPISIYRSKSKNERSFIRRKVPKVSLRTPDRSTTLIARLRADLDDLSNKLNSVFANSSSYIIILDRQLKVVDFNDAASKLVNKLFCKKIICGSCLDSFFKPTSQKRIAENIAHVLKGDKFTIELKINHSNICFGWWCFEFSPATNANGNINGIVFNATDISLRIGYEETINEQHRRLREISEKQSHEIRGPVSTILGLMNLIQESEYEPDPQYLRLLQITTEQLDENIREIVHLAEIDNASFAVNTTINQVACHNCWQTDYILRYKNISQIYIQFAVKKPDSLGIRLL